MATEAIVEVMGSTKEDGKGHAILESFKRIEMHSKKEIKKMKKGHGIGKIACSATKKSLCTWQDEMRWIKIENAFACTFSRVGNEEFANVLKSLSGKQESTDFEENRLFSTQLYLADDPDNDVRPSDTSMGVMLRDVQLKYEESGSWVILEFRGAKTAIPDLINLQICPGTKC